MDKDIPMEELTKILEKTISSSQTDQNEAIRFVQEYCHKDHTGFLKALADVLYNQQNSPVVRAAAGLQLKNHLASRDETARQQIQSRWRNLPETTRKHIKECVFKALGTEIFRPSSAPQCVASIGIIEMPEQQWPGLIPALAANITNPESTQQLRLASLEAIGYMCQEIDHALLSPEDSNHILNAIVLHGMKDDELDEIKRAATTAMMNFSETKIQRIARTQPKISFVDLGDHLQVGPDYAEKVVAEMIREERILGRLNQIEGMVYFEAKDALQIFDGEILKLCASVNMIVSKIKTVVPDEWWAAVMR